MNVDRMRKYTRKNDRRPHQRQGLLQGSQWLLCSACENVLVHSAGPGECFGCWSSVNPVESVAEALNYIQATYARPV